MSDPKLGKAKDFTSETSPKGGEVRTLEVWLIIALSAARLIGNETAQAIVRAINKNPVGSLAGRSLETGLLAEHYRSLLPDDLADATDEERETLDALRARFEAVVQEFLTIPPAKPDEQPFPDPPGMGS